MPRTAIKESFSAEQKSKWKPKIIERNTFEYVTEGGQRVVRLHHTDIVRFSPDESRITLDSGGWRTMTTSNRMNTALRGTPYRVGSDRGVWYVFNRNSEDKGALCVPFHDGIILPDAFSGKALEKAEREAEKQKKLKERITKFCAKLTISNFPMPSMGDCWLCCMKDKDGVSIGQKSGQERDNEHLLGHVKENYLHGSLIVNAILAAGYSKEQLGLFWPDANGRSFVDITRTRRYLRKYLCKAAGIPAR